MYFHKFVFKKSVDGFNLMERLQKIHVTHVTRRYRIYRKWNHRKSKR